MISRDIAETLIAHWAALELSEIEKVGYPDSSSGFSLDPVTRTPGAGASGVSPASIEAAGRAMQALKQRFPAQYRVLRRVFLDQQPAHKTALLASLDAFALVYVPPTRATSR